MNFIQDIFDPATSQANAQRRKLNIARYTNALKDNVSYNNRGTAFKRAKEGATIDRSIADSNVYSQQLQNQWKAFKGFEDWQRSYGQTGGPTGEGSRTAEAGRTAQWLNLIAQRSAIESSLNTESAAAAALHQNAVKDQNARLAARDKLGIRPAQKGLASMKGTNWGVAGFNMAKMAASIYAGGMSGAGAGAGDNKWDWTGALKAFGGG